MNNPFRDVTLITHADWSKNPAKRWIACASLKADNRWNLGEIRMVGEPSKLLFDLQSHRIRPGCIISGFDFPIGIPIAYAIKANITDFLSFLRILGKGEWKEFFTPATSSEEISLHQPFYPARAGASSRSHLAKKLDVPFNDLNRLCEKAHNNRRSACPLFWTMGGQQVGKAAIAGWKELLIPAIKNIHGNIKIWPFSGNFQNIVRPNNIVIVETYPAEFYTHLGLSFFKPMRRSKRNHQDRKAFSSQLIEWAISMNLDLNESLIIQISQGFDSGPSGEDQFDAIIGLYGMINVIMGSHETGEPLPPQLSKIEGWIFGQEQPKKFS